MKYLLTYMFVFFSLMAASTPLWGGEFDESPYLQNNPASFSAELFYPEFLRETDPITINNIVTEFRNRYEYFAGTSKESGQKACFDVQRRINRWIKRQSKRKGGFIYKWVDDRLLFDKDSPLRAKIRPTPIKAEYYCSFVSFGDLAKDGGVFCSYHGPDPRSDFYQNHIHRFTEARPFVTAYDITEILIFLPFLMVIPISWLIMKKVLANEKPGNR